EARLVREPVPRGSPEGAAPVEPPAARGGPRPGAPPARPLRHASARREEAAASLLDHRRRGARDVGSEASRGGPRELARERGGARVPAAGRGRVVPPPKSEDRVKA